MGLRAAITPGRDVIQTNKYTELSYNSEGYLHSFNVGTTTMVYCEHNDFKPYRITKERTISGYYPKDKYEEYLRKKITITDLVTNHSYSDKLVFAKDNDNVVVKPLTVKPPYYLDQLMTAEYTWNFQLNEEIFTNDIFRNLIIPQRAFTGVHYSAFIENPHPVTADFLDYNMNLIGNQTNEDDMKTIALLLNKIAANIDWIVEVMFPLFEDNPDFVSYMNLQKLEWSEGDMLQSLTKEQLASYLGAISSFRITGSTYRAEIDNDEGLDNLTKLSIMLSPNSLSILPLESRMKILKDLVNIELSLWREKIPEEHLVVKIVQSFTYNSISTINTFLERLSNPNINTYKQTLYQILYDRMSKDWNITTSTFQITNWLFNTKWKNDNTRGEFVKSVYTLWVVSKYNPYDLDTGLLKPHSIGVRKTENGVTSYETDDVDQDGDVIYSPIPTNEKLFYYTKYKGYNTIIDEAFNQNLLVEANFDASPILLNYSSRKKFGTYQDNGTFVILRDKIICYQHYLRKVKSNISVSSDNWTEDGTEEIEKRVFQGEYHLFQPIQLLNPEAEIIMPLPTVNGEDIDAIVANNGININSLIPIFLIHYVDDDGDSNDLQVCLGIALDIVTTFSGVGNLIKLRHLRHLTKFQVVRAFLGTVEFTAGVLSFMLNFVEGCNEDGFCKRLKTFLFWLEMGSLSGDAITARMTKSSAKNIVDNGFPPEFDNQAARNKIEELAQYVDTAEDIERVLANYLTEVRKLIDARITKDKSGVFNKGHYSQEFSDIDLKDLINQCLNMNIRSKPMIADFVAMACRAKKKSSKLELLIQITYYKKVILVKGFPSGFASLDDFKLFCNKVKSYLDSFDEFPLEYLELRVQGSTLKQRYFNDPPDPNNIPYLTRDGQIVNPDDIDIDIVVTEEFANRYIKYAKEYWGKKLDYFELIEDNKGVDSMKQMLKDLDKAAQKGIIHGFMMPPKNVNGNFSIDLISSQKRSNGTDIFLPKSQKSIPPYSKVEVSASLVVKGSDYDLLPTFSFKY